MATDEKGTQLPSPDHLPHERIVAFLDILGFRDLVSRMPTEPKLYSLMKDMLKLIQQGVQTHYDKGAPSKLSPDDDTQLVAQMTHFSDSIVMSFPLCCPALAATWTIYESRRLAGKLLLDGVFVRGGIACGWTYHEQNVLLGAGMNAAYELESKVARVPRIIVADEVVSLLPDYVREPCLRQDSDGYWYVHIFSWFWDEWKKEEAAQPLSLVRENIRLGSEQAKRKGPNLLAKYRWLTNQFNAFTKEIFQSMDINIEPIEMS